jgi:hypothetical protein
MPKLNRRHFLGSSAAATAALAVPMLAKRARAQTQAPRFLFTFAAVGGASVTDSFMPVLTGNGQAGGLNTYDAADVVQVGDHRCVRALQNQIQGGVALGTDYSMETFLQRHGSDLTVMTHEVTSVNHVVASQRAMTGANYNAGRTLPEALAAQRGELMPLPHVTMAAGGYSAPGTDASCPAYARGETVADARVLALGAHGSRGLSDRHDLVEAGRDLRARLEHKSPFVRTFRERPIFKGYRDSRRQTEALEQAQLFNSLNLLPPSERAALGVPDLPELNRVREVFPQLDDDALAAQAALAYLLTRSGASTAVTMGSNGSPNLINGTLPEAPLVFDFSHNDHRATQNSMWGRLMEIVDGLITLLKETPMGDGTMWDHSFVYIATEFGRDKVLSQPGSGHHLNNGSVMISPLLNGGRVYGGVDPSTGLTFGFDPQTGAPDTGRIFREGDVYSVVADALDVDFAGRASFPCMIRG